MKISPKKRKSPSNCKNHNSHMSMEKLINCLHNLDHCLNYAQIIDKYLKVLGEDLLLDKNGLILLINRDPIETGQNLILCLYVKRCLEKGLTNIKINHHDSIPINIQYIDTLITNKMLLPIKNLKQERIGVLNDIQCLSYYNFPDFQIWRKYVDFTYIGSLNRNVIASNLMIYSLHHPEGNKKMLTHFLKNMIFEEKFINHIERYADVIRYHRGIFIQSIKNIDKDKLSLEEATSLSEQWLKYSFWNIKTPETLKLTHSKFINILLKCSFSKIKNDLIKGLIWEQNSCGKEIDGGKIKEEKTKIEYSYLISCIENFTSEHPDDMTIISDIPKISEGNQITNSLNDLSLDKDLKPPPVLLNKLKNEIEK